jgi:aminoglycoside phosphotransferase (APT) family kinase protein
MHKDEVHTDIALVSQLLAAQFPQWAELPIKPVPSAGTDNALYRLGDEMVVRLPRIPAATAQVHKEQRWLPVLAPHLPLSIPVPLAMGKPSEGYPWHWSVYQWIKGQNATAKPLADQYKAAEDLARFIKVLRGIDPEDGPYPGAHNFFRGVPLSIRDQQTRIAIAALNGTLDIDAAIVTWEASLRAPVWQDPPVWIHGDLQSGNLLVQDGRLNAVIDFGAMGVGDPACDLIPAWSVFSGRAREIFREALAVDEATWVRGQGWALSFGLIALPYYVNSNPILAEIARHTIDEVLADHL